jgi:ribosomal protein S18 acetylase RimI-like enzyme
MRLRPAKPADADAVAAVFTPSFAGLAYLPRLHTAEEDRAHFRGLLERGHELWVAEEDGRIRGFAHLHEDVLQHLYVHPEAQGRGIGSALLDRVKERRPDGFQLWVFQRNEGARRFYERHGMRLVEVTDGAGNEEREPDARYEWRP